MIDIRGLGRITSDVEAEPNTTVLFISTCSFTFTFTFTYQHYPVTQHNGRLQQLLLLLLIKISLCSFVKLAYFLSSL